MNYGDREKANSMTFNNAALTAQMNDPQLKGIVDLMSRLLNGKPLEALSPATRMNFMQAAAIAQNSISPMMGIQTGAERYADIYQGVAASGQIPLQGHMGRGVLGSFSGQGNLTANVASQIMTSMYANTTNKYGGMNLDVTNGLSMNTISQVYGQLARNRSWKNGDVAQVNFGGTSASITQQLESLQRNGWNTDTKEFQSIKQLRDQLSNYEKNIQGGMSKSDAITALYNDNSFSGAAKELAVNTLTTGRSDSQLVRDNVFKDLDNGLKNTSKTIKELSEIFKTEDLNELQQNAKALALGSLTDANNVNYVQKRVREAQAQANKTGRRVQEIFMEQADIVQGLAAAYGGEQYVPVSAISRISALGTRAKEEYDKGLSALTPEDRIAAAAKSEVDAARVVGGIALMQRAFKEVQGPSKEMQERYNELNKQFNEATTTDQKQRISRQAEQFAKTINPYLNQNDMQAAIRDYGRDNDMTGDFLETAAQDNIKTMMKRYRRRGTKQGGLFEGATEETFAITEDLASNVFKAVGGDRLKLKQIFEDSADGNIKDESYFTQRGINKTDSAKLFEVMNKFSNLGQGQKDAIRTALNQMQTDSAISQTKGSITKAEEAVSHIQEILGEDIGKDRISGDFASQIMSGLLKTSGAKDEEILKADIVSYKANGGGALWGAEGVGKLSNDGTLEGYDKKVLKEILATGGVKDDEIERLLSDDNLGSGAGTGELITKMKELGSIVSVDGDIYYNSKKELEARRDMIKKTVDDYGLANVGTIEGATIKQVDADAPTIEYKENTYNTTEEFYKEVAGENAAGYEKVKEIASKGDEKAQGVIDTFNEEAAGKLNEIINFAHKNGGMDEESIAALTQMQGLAAQGQLSAADMGTIQKMLFGNSGTVYSVSNEKIRAGKDGAGKIDGGLLRGRGGDDAQKIMNDNSDFKDATKYFQDMSDKFNIKTTGGKEATNALLNDILRELQTLNQKTK